MKKMQRIQILILLLLVILSLSCTQYQRAQQDLEQFHNVIVLIPDGCGVAHMTIARWFKGAPLVQDALDMSLVHTHSANSMITGSAAAATAFATGYKTWEDSRKAKCLSMLPDSLLLPNAQELPASERWRPVATVLEGARLAGKSVGLVATCRVSHATPAAYASHWHSRYNNNVVIEQMVYQDLDVVFGGGFRYLIEVDAEIPGSVSKGTREDEENLYEVLLSRGYRFVDTRAELLALEPNTPRVWGIFADGHMVHDLDRTLLAPEQPSLTEMTKKAIEILSQNPQGFFLMVEGSQVDWSSENNDPVGLVTDYLAFDQAVDVALRFAASHAEQRTLVLIFPDHDCGGLSLGSEDVKSYEFQPDDMIDIVNNASLTADGVEILFRNRPDNTNPDVICRIMTQYYGIDDLTPEEIDVIQAELSDTGYYNLRTIIGPILSKRAGIGWTTFGHTGNDVPMFSYGLNRVPRTIDNTEIAHLCARAMGFQLSDVTERLFVDAGLLFEDATLIIDTVGVEMSKGHLTVQKNAKRAVFPFFKNIMITDQDTISLEGITVYSIYANRIFLPSQAAMLFEE
jgi:alkaline phosphatase